MSCTQIHRHAFLALVGNHYANDTSNAVATCLDIFHSWRGAYQNLDARAPVFYVDRLMMALGRGEDTVLCATGVEIHFEYVAAHKVLDGRA